MRPYIDLIENAISGLTRQSVDAFGSAIQAKYGLKAFFLSLNDQGVKLDSLIVHKDRQRQGTGSAAMRDLCAFADQHHARLLLTPGTTDRHNGTTSQARLKLFYKGFGFVENAGRRRDFSISSTMIREPRGGLTEAADLSFDEQHHGYGHGQHDLSLVARRGTEIVGAVDFSLYQGEVAIKMIRSAHERQGIGSAMMRELQRRYPDQEIEWGSLTAAGAGLYDKLEWDEVEVPEVRAKIAQMVALRTRLDGFQAALDAFEQGKPSEAARERLMALVEPWNAVQDEFDRLEREVGDLRPSKRLIRT